MEKKYVKIFANTIVSRGANRSLILDMQREKFESIPNDLQGIMESFFNKMSIEDVYKMYGIENKIIIDEYINFLIDNEFAFFSDEIEYDLFVDLNKNFEISSHITNCIIEISEINILHLEKIIESLENLLCKNIQLISYDEINTDTFKLILEKTMNGDFRSIEFVLKYDNNLIEFIPNIDKINFRVSNILIHSSLSTNKIMKKTTFAVNFIEKSLKSFSNCGVVEFDFFNINNFKVLESLNHNSCLNKKISIDKDGTVKNCPSMKDSFGNIKDTTLEEALNHPNFKNYWNINKDQIEICKDCEFRHVCTDCRAYIEEPDNQYSKPLKCGYNPYTNEWEKWSTNPLKQKAIEFYGMQDLVKKDG